MLAVTMPLFRRSEYQCNVGPTGRSAGPTDARVLMNQMLLARARLMSFVINPAELD